MISISSKRFGEDLEIFEVKNEAGEVWAFEPEEDGLGWGSGHEHVWIGSPTQIFRIYHVASRTKTAEISLPRQSQKFRMLKGSADGSRLFVLDPIDADQSTTLHVIDLAAGRIAASHTGLPGFTSVVPIEWPDGRLFIWNLKRPDHSGISVATIDPASGERVIEILSTGPAWDRVVPSSDGEYLLRPDPCALGLKSVGRNPSKLFGFRHGSGGDGQRYYGVVWQVWKTDPLRFVRRIVVAWLKPEEMRGSFGFQHEYEPDEALKLTREMWDVVASVMADTNSNPGVGAPSRSSFPKELVADDAMWRRIYNSFENLGTSGAEFKAWEDDGEAFWVTTNGYLSRVGIDGTISPRLYFERLGLAANTTPPCAVEPSSIRPLRDYKAQAEFSSRGEAPGGSAIVDGTPSDEIVRAISQGDDHWRESPKAIPIPPDPRGNRIDIPLSDWSNAAIARAIDDLTAEITPDLARRADDYEIALNFKSAGKLISEAEFFDRLPRDRANLGPALRRLVDQYAAAALQSEFLYSNTTNGHGFLSGAVLTLGLIDPEALPTVQAYGRVVDREHEYQFAGRVVPAIVQAHGWSDVMVDFVFWVMIRNYFNTLTDFNAIWTEWGLRDALDSRDPIAWAQRVVGANRRALTSGKFAAGRRKGGLKQLGSDVPKPHDSWLATFLKEADRLLK
ncbi:hypothetical protein G4G27_14430 [Sphingomonas sp. So64.6b]|uniref:hypothetical protein n=1 Tax=Sphingomonas sp. So64.6b TaxID=2997354 RepID=UPI001601552C|nr:hypothetical protein [Sphingomonas sp. So64.6b]QNA85059.1 hypothetical protein G4G27_14430 [Sphingomonas sp. So64.6b]